MTTFAQHYLYECIFAMGFHLWHFSTLFHNFCPPIYHRWASCLGHLNNELGISGGLHGCAWLKPCYDGGLFDVCLESPGQTACKTGAMSACQVPLQGQQGAEWPDCWLESLPAMIVWVVKHVKVRLHGTRQAARLVRDMLQRDMLQRDLLRGNSIYMVGSSRARLLHIIHVSAFFGVGVLQRKLRQLLVTACAARQL